MENKPEFLAANTVLGDYKLTRVIGGGGFSIVYLAESLRSGEVVVIKEYYPSKFAKRDEQHHVVALDEKSHKLFKQGRQLFFQEASMLAALHHPNIVDVQAFFHANGTVYTVMAYQPGVSLYNYIKRQKQKPSESFIRQVFAPVLDSLRVVHEHGLLHLDIKPGNIYLRQGAQPLLLDFGAVQKLLRSADCRLCPVVSHGFSPLEQSRRNGHLGPWSDLYAVGATIRACIEKKTLVSAKDRYKKDTLIPASKAFKGQYSPTLLAAIDWSMRLLPKQRPQNVEEFLHALGWSVPQPQSRTA